MVLSEADKMLLKASTAEDTIKALEMGANVNARGFEGRTKLHDVCLCNIKYSNEKRCSKIALILLSNGANINAQDDHGLTPLMYAEMNNTPLDDLLLKHSANISLMDRWGNTVLDRACQAGNEKFVDSLTEHGVNINQKEASVALIHAAKNGHLSLVKKLKEMGADINAQDVEGRTAIIASIDRVEPYPEVVDFLIKNGADLSNKNRYRKSPLEVAKEWHHAQIELMLQKGHLQERQEYLAERKGEKVSSSAEATTHDSNSPAPSKPNGRDDGGR
ncbi:MAG: ankyrin repeat domain-containing protein [Alphaproteobacteria bacterium]|nr:ankyrin repeat domain-containing protein [Alphaproteobacteria bacterium]